jgi:hypothetical protein
MTTRSMRDKLGRVTRISKIAYQNGRLGTEQAQVRFEYRGDGFSPTLVARPGVVPGKELVTGIDYNETGQSLSVSRKADGASRLTAKLQRHRSRARSATAMSRSTAAAC